MPWNKLGLVGIPNRTLWDGIRDNLSGVVRILRADKAADKQAILSILAELRTLIEEHLEGDVSQLLGGI